MAQHIEGFPLIGARFEDKDPRAGTRVIRIISFATILGYERKGYYRYVTEVSEYSPKRVGKFGTISAKTLEKRFTKLSH